MFQIAVLNGFQMDRSNQENGFMVTLNYAVLAALSVLSIAVAVTTKLVAVVLIAI